jgi:hypothetical protein
MDGGGKESGMRIFPVFGTAAGALPTGGCGPRQSGAGPVADRDGSSAGMEPFRCPAGTR